MSQIQEITPKELHDWIEKDAAILIDVREIEEYQDLRIPGSILIPLGSCGPAVLPHNPDKKIVFHCAHGRRGLKACESCIKNLPQKVVYHLSGGIDAWKNEGYKVEQGVDSARL